MAGPGGEDTKVTDGASTETMNAGLGCGDLYARPGQFVPESYRSRSTDLRGNVQAIQPGRQFGRVRRERSPLLGPVFPVHRGEHLAPSGVEHGQHRPAVLHRQSERLEGRNGGQFDPGGKGNTSGRGDADPDAGKGPGTGTDRDPVHLRPASERLGSFVHRRKQDFAVNGATLRAGAGQQFENGLSVMGRGHDRVVARGVEPDDLQGRTRR